MRIDILVLCTGNICRSPMAEAMLRRRLDAIGVSAHLHSAGIARAGVPASPPGVDVMAERGFDLSAHRSRRMTAEMIARADLVLGMAREHIHNAVAIVNEAFPRAFTLKELVRRARAVGPRRAGEPMDAWLERLHEGRTYRDLRGWSDADDVTDPIGLTRDVYESIAEELTVLLDELMPLAWPAGLAPDDHAADTREGTR